MGKAEHEAEMNAGEGRIRINRIADSPDIDEPTLRFLLWHEYLHLFLKQGHTSEFRIRERAWPGYLEADRVLDSLDERFNVRYWGRAAGRAMKLPLEIEREQSRPPTRSIASSQTTIDVTALPDSSGAASDDSVMRVSVPVRQPWAWAILHGGKDIENRSRPVRLRGTIALHAAARPPREEEIAEVERLCGRRVPRDLPLGAVIGTVDIVDSREDSDSEWAEPEACHWVLSGPTPFKTPIPATGALGFWKWNKAG